MERTGSGHQNRLEGGDELVVAEGVDGSHSREVSDEVLALCPQEEEEVSALLLRHVDTGPSQRHHGTVVFKLGQPVGPGFQWFPWMLEEGMKRGNCYRGRDSRLRRGACSSAGGFHLDSQSKLGGVATVRFGRDR